MPCLDSLEEALFSHYRACELCPHCCGVDRTNGQVGFCGEGTRLRIATIEAHLGEEPPIGRKNGSGTVFFSGCSLRCLFCQNYQISREGLGMEWTLQEVGDRLAASNETAKHSYDCRGSGEICEALCFGSRVRQGLRLRG